MTAWFGGVYLEAKGGGTMKQSILFTFFMVILGTSALVPVKAQDDLIYVAVEPCRIVDTRNAGGGIPADTSRGFLASGTSSELAAQGGTADCENPRAGLEPLAISAYVLATGGSTKNGVLTAFPAGNPTVDPAPGAGSTLNFAKGQVIGNTTTITLCDPTGACPDGDFAILARNTDQNVVVDVQGYFYPQRQASAIRHLFGVVKFDTTCDQCHAAGTHDPDGTGSDIAGKGNLLVNDLGTLSVAMSGIILTNQEVLDLQAFIDDPSIQP